MSNEQREHQMMTAAEAYAEEAGYKDEHDLCATLNVFCAGWRAADQHPQWIPVEERLPERMNEKSRFSKTVLVYNKDGYKDTAYYDFEEKIWRWLPSVTHWMPLPEAPRKEAKNEQD